MTRRTLFQQNLCEAQLLCAKYYNARHVPVTFNRDDHVLIKAYVISSAINNINDKLSHKYVGPYKVMGVLSPVTYTVQNLADPTEIKVQHVSQLKL